MLGCHSERPDPVEVFKHPELEEPAAVHRCPRALVDASVAELLELAVAGYMKSLPPRERRRLPNLLVRAVEWLETLLRSPDE